MGIRISASIPGLGNAIRTDLQNKGLTQVDVADNLHVTQQALSQWIKKDKIPAKHLRSAIRIFGKDSETVLRLRAQVDTILACAQDGDALDELLGTADGYTVEAVEDVPSQPTDTRLSPRQRRGRQAAHARPISALGQAALEAFSDALRAEMFSDRQILSYIAQWKGIPFSAATN